MGSLYDIGNFRYKHFTFYSCKQSDGGDVCESSPPMSIDENGNDVDELINFLDRTWPHKGIFIGDSSEGDYAFVTYVSQTTDKLNVDQIYVYKRVRAIDVATSTPSETKYLLVWERVIDPVTSLKPGITQTF
jgi:hypothetical protein|tara:strand:+ start:66 stop:461 length:396 start_codon:yes stop_codon:yes gene_type:complete